VGFLGAGLIWKGPPEVVTSDASGGGVTKTRELRPPQIKGLTTAASAWLSAAVGVSCGGGQFFVAMFTVCALSRPVECANETSADSLVNAGGVRDHHPKARAKELRCYGEGDPRIRQPTGDSKSPTAATEGCDGPTEALELGPGSQVARPAGGARGARGPSERTRDTPQPPNATQR
jgi:hypothetical protein